MKYSSFLRGSLPAILLILLTGILGGGEELQKEQAAVPGAGSPRAENLPALPLSFEQNLGQLDASQRFAARGRGFRALLDDRGMTVEARWATDGWQPLRFDFGEGAQTEPVPGVQLVGRTHYLSFADPSSQQVDIPTFGEIRYPSVRPGIDLAVSGDREALSLTLHVAAGAALEDLSIGLDGTTTLEPMSDGGLRLRTGDAVLHHGRPLALQGAGDEAVELPAALVPHPGAGLGVAVTGRDEARPLRTL